jgi:hypothetical protein
MELTLIRGDTQSFKFRRLDNDGIPVLSKPSEIYFTMKTSLNTKEAVLQKLLPHMTFNENTGYYSFIIEPKDTNELDVGKYVYDIKVVDGDYKQTISSGVITITSYNLRYKRIYIYKQLPNRIC